MGWYGPSEAVFPEVLCCLQGSESWHRLWTHTRQPRCQKRMRPSFIADSSEEVACMQDFDASVPATRGLIAARLDPARLSVPQGKGCFRSPGDGKPPTRFGDDPELFLRE